MACMEHVCRRCDWAAFDNQARTCCPQHPGETSHFFDEPEHDDPDERNDEEDVDAER